MERAAQGRNPRYNGAKAADHRTPLANNSGTVSFGSYVGNVRMLSYEFSFFRQPLNSLTQDLEQDIQAWDHKNPEKARSDHSAKYCRSDGSDRRRTGTGRD